MVLARLEEQAIIQGYTVLHLDTTVQQVSAQRFYEKNGFAEVRRENWGKFICIIYEKTIGE